MLIFGVSTHFSIVQVVLDLFSDNKELLAITSVSEILLTARGGMERCWIGQESNFRTHRLEGVIWYLATAFLVHCSISISVHTDQDNRQPAIIVHIHIHR